MIRDVDLVSYLPPFMQKYKEPVEALEAESPEFTIIWDGADRILYNHFISTADEDGIRRFEKLLGISPANEDTIESRRMRCQSKWFSRIPYTMRVLLQKLTVLCGDKDFTVTENFGEGYTLALETGLELHGQVEELENMLDAIVPCNLIISTRNAISSQVSGMLFASGGISVTQDITITS